VNNLDERLRAKFGYATDEPVDLEVVEEQPVEDTQAEALPDSISQAKLKRRLRKLLAKT
jgi:hypothetical protein